MVEALPVDTHVWQIAQRDYNFGKGKHKSLTKSTYDAIGDFFRMLWGKEAGWAHSVLFATDLRTFAIRVATKDVKAEAMNIKLEGDITKTLTEKRELEGLDEARDGHKRMIRTREKKRRGVV
jgi:N-glycosylase/DNA lyase